MSEKAYRNDYSCGNYVGSNGIYAAGFNEQPQQKHSGKSSCSVNDITLEILLEPVAFCSEYKELVAQKGVGYRKDVGWNGKDHIVDTFAEQLI